MKKIPSRSANEASEKSTLRKSDLSGDNGGQRCNGSQINLDPSHALGMSMLRAREVVISYVRPILRAHGLTEQQWRVLRFLAAESPQSVVSLSRRTTIMLPSLLRMLDVMVKENLVTRTPKGPGRASVVLTIKGFGLVRKLLPQILKAQEPLRRLLTQRERETLVSLLKKLGEYSAGS
jgi:homoprotocatechuate degradation regulator HpaR